MMKIKYKGNKKIIKSLYVKLGLGKYFDNDNKYLESAFEKINDIWIDNFNKIDKVKYLLIAEAPLWGKDEKYFYNPNKKNTQFFYRNDLGEVLNIEIGSKKELIRFCNKIGLLIIDISPFPLNSKDTKINYRKKENKSKKLNKNEYEDLVSKTLPLFFEQKIKLIKEKKENDIKIFFRYTRVKKAFYELIKTVLVNNKFIKSSNHLVVISQSGGGIDRTKLKQILINERKRELLSLNAMK